jgi:hypothetical protein
LKVRSVALVSAALAAACGPKQGEGPPVGVSSGSSTPSPLLSDKAASYVFDPLDDRVPVSSSAHRGKPTIIAFVTTGSTEAQAQVDFLIAMFKNDGDKTNYAVVALHPRRDIPLVDTYRKVLGAEFPFALGDAASTAPGGPFGDIPAVPTVVVLDRDGRVVWKKTGLAKADEIRAHMK